jgi:hypothetical protein
MTYQEEVDQAWRDALRSIASGDPHGCIEATQRVQTFDDLLDRLDVNSPEELEDAIVSLSGAGNVDDGAAAVVSDLVLRRECQLHLLRGIATLEDAQMVEWFDALRQVLESACFLEGLHKDAADHVFRAAVAIHCDDPLTCGRLSLWAARYFAHQEEREMARKWLDTIDIQTIGPLTDSFRRLHEGLTSDEPWEGA